MVSEKLYRNTLKILIQKSCSACCFLVRSRSMKIRCTIQINQLSLGQRPGTRMGKNIFDACPFNRDVKFLSWRLILFWRSKKHVSVLLFLGLIISTFSSNQWHTCKCLLWDFFGLFLITRLSKEPWDLQKIKVINEEFQFWIVRTVFVN